MAAAADPLVLPCGLQLENRLVKAAMEECLASLLDGLPNELHYALYEQWSACGYGVLITGNVQVSSSQLGTPFDVAVGRSPNPSKQQLQREAWRGWSTACRSTPCLVQLNHPGRQSPRGLLRWFTTPSIAPSAIPLGGGGSWVSSLAARIAFGHVKEASVEELKHVARDFIEAAKLAQRAGFAGVQIHCSHGYLLAQMMSPSINKRQDCHGKAPPDRLRLLFEIVERIRATCGVGFCISIKMNCRESKVNSPQDEQDSVAFQQFKWIVEHGGVDLIEISGGSYEDPVFAGEVNPQNSEAWFRRFSSECKRFLAGRSGPQPAIMLTGGIRQAAQISSCLQQEEADLIGIGRPACVDSQWPHRLLAQQEDSLEYEVRGIATLRKMMPLQIAGYGLNTGWHCFQTWRLARRKRVQPEASFLQLAWMELIPLWVKLSAIVMIAVAVLR